MNDFSNAESICRIDNPLTWTDHTSNLMVKACREMALFHQQNCPDIAKLYQRHSFDPATIEREIDLERIPPVGVQAMKYYLLTSLPQEQAVLKLTSSGTRGQKTQIWFDQPSLDRVMAMLASLWQQQGLISTTPTNYLMMIYDPKDAKDLGIAFSLRNQQRFAPPLHTEFAIRKDTNDEWSMDISAVMDCLQRYVSEGHPVRIHGIPAFIFDLVEHIEKIGQCFSLPINSRIITGGGWKIAEGRQVTKEDFRRRISSALGVNEDFILDGFGMAEHSAPYNECTAHHFHVPAYCRIFIRNPETLAIEKPNQVGLMEFLTPYNAMMPNLAILSTDLGYLDAEPCSCGLNSPTFTLVGRGGLSKHKGCAISANELVKRRA